MFQCNQALNIIEYSEPTMFNKHNFIQKVTENVK